jgi:hypothetical protein
MKRIPLLLALLFCGLLVSAQPTLNIYAYERDLLPGMVPSGTRGTGVQKEYLIYVKTGSPIVPVRVWINGQAYNAKLMRVTTPVTGHSMVPGQVPVLVAKTTVPVYQLSLVPVKMNVRSSLSRTNAVVFQYQYKQKNYMRTVASLKKLEPKAAE